MTGNGLDEPMNGLDREGVAEMRKFFSDQRSMGKLILLASHNKEDIEVLCDEVYEIVQAGLFLLMQNMQI